MELRNRRHPLTRRSHSAVERAQLLEIVGREGYGSLAEAAKNPELSIVTLDVIDESGALAWTLYLWPFGSGVLFRAGTTERAAEITQHAFAWMGANDERHAALAAAFTASSDALGLEDGVDFSPRAPLSTGSFVLPPTGGNVAAALGQIPTSAATYLEGQRLSPVLAPLVAGVFGQAARRSPKLRLSALTDDQRAVAERCAAVHYGLASVGLFDAPDDLRRFLGQASQGPCDQPLIIPGEAAPLPIWNALGEVGLGLLDAKVALKAWQALPPSDALAAWEEVARGDAYDVFVAPGKTPHEDEIPLTPFKTKYWVRLFGFLVDGNLALGEPGRGAAERLAAGLASAWEPASAFVALLTLARRAKSLGEPLPATYAPVLARLANEPNRASRRKYSWVHAPPLEKMLGLEAQRTAR